MYNLIIKEQDLICVFCKERCFLGKLRLLFWAVWAGLVHGTEHNFVTSLRLFITWVWYLLDINMICLLLSPKSEYYAIVSGSEVLHQVKS